MMRIKNLRPSTAFAAAAMAFMSACTNETMLAPESAPQVSALVVSNATVVIPGATPGAFVAATPSNVGRGNGGAFWDNKSADELIASDRCNSGYYALGTNFSTTCDNEPLPEGSSDVNRGGYTTYFGDGDGNRDATAFSFAAGFEYTVTLRGTYAGASSEVGYYTVDNGTYDFEAVPAWGAKTVGTSVTINTGGKPWGFYIKNTTYLPAGQGCGNTDYYCSQAEGGFAGTPRQQFALFGNATGTQWLAGVEDNVLNVLPNEVYQDSDYNDYMFSITATPIEEPAVCDFMTFGRTQIEANGVAVVISGNAGGNSPQGGILGNFLVKVGDAQYNLQDIAFYGPIPSNPVSVFSGASYPNARRIVGTTRENVSVEIRIYDGGEPGRIDDAVYLNIGGATPLGANGTDLNRGNIQYHPQCRGPKA